MEFTATTTGPQDYRVVSDLSKLCLPQEYRDTNRRLAWANSVCLLVLIIGLFGIKPPPIQFRQLTVVEEVVPVVIVPPEEETPPPPTTEPQAEPEPTAEITPDQPVVATVVAADASAAAFAVPVHGPVILAPTARMAAPPPANLNRPPSSKPVALQSSEEDWGGGSGQVEYPRVALMNRYQGTVTLEITFDPTGAIQSVKLQKSSGYSSLDNAAMDKVRKSLRLRVPPGVVRVYTKDFTFQMR